jgi:glycosyltransferase involved in cell wall biosynthesis
MNVSVVIPLLNEAESLPELVSWIDTIMKLNNFEYEVIFVDDGSSDNSWQVIDQLHNSYPSIRGIKFRRNFGKSAALHIGFQQAKGRVVITMDADLQDSPEEIPGLYKMIVEDGYDLVSGWKKKRYDPISKTLPSKFYNWTARVITGIKLHDFNCGLKAYRNEVVKAIEVYGEMHRYIPVIARRAGFAFIGEKEVQHQKRKYGSSKFGMKRFVTGYLDLLSSLLLHGLAEGLCTYLAVLVH